MNDQTFFAILIVAAVICGGIATACCHPSRNNFAFLLGFLFGPIGIIIACLLRPLDAPAADAPTAPRPAPPAPRPDMPALPDLFTLRRGTDIFGPYTLDELTDHIRDGLILPTDQYRTPAGHWALLTRTGLV